MKCGMLGAAAIVAVLLSAAPAALADSSPLATGHPDLIAAAASATQVLACFDEILATPPGLTDANFYLQGYAEGHKSGTGLMLSTAPATLTNGGYCVVATFTGTGDARSYSRLVVLAGAVAASVPGGPGSPNVQGSAALLGSTLSTTPGATDGPNLQSFTIDRMTGIVAFVFDSPVSSAMGKVSPMSFHLVDRSAVLTAPPTQCSSLLTAPPPQFTVGPATTVNVNFAAVTPDVLGLCSGPPDLRAVRSAVGVTVDEGAVTSTATPSVLSPVFSLGVTQSSTPPPGPTTPPAPPVPSFPSSPLPPPSTPAPKKCRRVITLHLKSVVSSRLRSATVTVNGKKVKVSNKLTVTINFDRYRGIKSIVIKVKGKLTGKTSVSRTKTYKNKC